MLLPGIFTTPTAAVRAIAGARAISITGGAAAFAALNLAIYQQTRSEAWLATTMLLTFGVAGVVGLFAGMLGDRFDRQKVMIGSDLVSGIFFIALIFTDDPGWMLFFAFLSAVCEAPLWAASGAAIPNLVPADRVAWANSLSQLGHNFGVLVGPAIVGVFYDFTGARPIFILNAASFVVSASLTAMVRGTFAGDREDAGEHAGFTAGLRFMIRDHVLRWMNLSWVFLVVGLGIVMTADVPFAELFDAANPGSYYGWMIGSWGAGSVVGALLGRRITVRTEGPVLLIGTLIFTATLGAIAPMTIFFFVPVLIFTSGLAEGVGHVAELNITQRRAPDAVRSRVLSASQAVVDAALALGFVAAGPVLSAVGPRWAYAIGGGISFLAALLLIPAVSELRRSLAEKPEEAEEIEELTVSEFPAPDAGTITGA